MEGDAVQENRSELPEDPKTHREKDAPEVGNDGQLIEQDPPNRPEETAEDEAEWIVHECPVCHLILRARTVPAGVHEGVLHERIETQYLRIHGSERFWLNGGLL
jgi:hypothetical protein